ncbi:molybdate transport system regulatory protein [Paraburkholderia phenazinium]|uniref:Molybdate transport system regulatory protein n=2 Tax=Paraburkholderia phenazinium TaxID=60549 RepID=A0A1G8ASJ3_9BURK|nr:LysR family transcriptional regulator [Paraburkholderia phenazinium]SDH23945.1 molybdate transport system regulatory protein [Paraburkholderia phenazinium]
MAESAKIKPAPAKPAKPAKKAAAKTGVKAVAQAPAKAPTAARGKARPEVRFRMRIRKAGTVALGPGKVELLEAVREHGSISAAARSLDMSYRRAWLLIDELNQSLKSPATVSEQGGQSGGGCVLTSVGENIVRLYRDVEAQAEKACAKEIAELIRLMRA